MKPYHIFKRIMDIIFSSLFIIILIPIFIIIVIIIRLNSSGSAVYTHTRIGKGGRPFKIYKFRTMIVGARELQKKGTEFSSLITIPGRFLRKTFLDETLQLINIFKGDISFVGPRPFDVEMYKRYTKVDKNWKKLTMIKPGLTSLESVFHYLPDKEKKDFESEFDELARKDNTRDLFIQKYVIEKYYVDHESFRLDVKIIFYTILLAIRKMFSKA